MKQFIMFKIDNEDEYNLLHDKLDEMGYFKLEIGTFRSIYNKDMIGIGVSLIEKDGFDLGAYTINDISFRNYKEEIIFIKDWKIEDFNNIFNLTINGNKMGLL